MVTLVLDPEVQSALQRKALECDRTVDEIASMVLSRLMLGDE
jgi:hypothetical protein